MKKIKRAFFSLIIFSAVVLFSSCASFSGSGGREPDIKDDSYGPYERNSFDFWSAKTDKPAPLYIFIHGGGFTSGSKEKISAVLVEYLLNRGISVMAINYRLSPKAIFPEHYMDCARAIQYARYKAAELNINPDKIAAGGSSAGACTALWIAFRNDMADAQNNDPVLKMSTRLSCVVSFSGQTTLVPDTIRKWIGNMAEGHSFMKGGFFGITPAEMKSEKGIALCIKASPITYLTKDDPPVWMYYSVTEPPSNISEAIHHVNFGIKLKEQMDALGIESILRTPADTKSTTKEVTEFLIRHFGIN